MSLPSVITLMEGTYNIPLYKNILFFMTTDPNWIGFLSRTRDADNYWQFHNPKPYSDKFSILKVIDVESLIVFFEKRYNLCQS